jgi:hypothetical protein
MVCACYFKCIIKKPMVRVIIYVGGTKVGLEVDPPLIVSERFLSIVDLYI